MGDDKKKNEKGGKRRDAESESAYSPDADGAMSGDEAAITSLTHSLTHSLPLVKPKLSLSFFKKSPCPVKTLVNSKTAFSYSHMNIRKIFL